MIETVVISYLKNQLDVPVLMGELPATYQGTEYVLVKTIDVGRINMIDAVTFNIESYSDSLLHAAELNNTVKDAMYNIISISSVSSSKCGGGGQKIDTTTKTYCYDCIFNLYYTE